MATVRCDKSSHHRSQPRGEKASNDCVGDDVITAAPRDRLWIAHELHFQCSATLWAGLLEARVERAAEIPGGAPWSRLRRVLLAERGVHGLSRAER